MILIKVPEQELSVEYYGLSTSIVLRIYSQAEFERIFLHVPFLDRTVKNSKCKSVECFVRSMCISSVECFVRSMCISFV